MKHFCLQIGLYNRHAAIRTKLRCRRIFPNFLQTFRIGKTEKIPIDGIYGPRCRNIGRMAGFLQHEARKQELKDDTGIQNKTGEEVQ